MKNLFTKFILVILFTSQIMAAEKKCDTTTVIQILSNKPIEETRAKLCVYYYKNIFVQKELTSELCKNLIEPCSLVFDPSTNMETGITDYNFKLNEFWLASQLKDIDDEYNQEISDIEFFKSLALNFTPEELKDVPKCNDVIKTETLDQCSSFQDIPRRALIETFHYNFAHAERKMSENYVNLVLYRAELNDRRELSHDKLQMTELDKALLDIDAQIKESQAAMTKSRFENGFVPINYNKNDTMLSSMLESLRNRDPLKLNIQDFRIPSMSSAADLKDSEHQYEKDIILNSWWRAHDGQSDDKRKNELDKLIRSVELTPANMQAKTSELIKKIRLNMAKEVATMACSETSLKRQREIKKQGGLCAILGKKISENKIDLSIEHYFNMYPQESERLESSPFKSDEVRKHFNDNIALWTCANIAPSRENNSDKFKISKKEWDKLAESIKKENYATEKSSAEKISKAFEKIEKHKEETARIIAANKLENAPAVRPENTSSNTATSKIQVPIPEKNNTANSLAKNSFTPINNTFIPDVSTNNAPVNNKKENYGSFNDDVEKDDQLKKIEKEKPKTKMDALDSTHSEDIKSLQAEIDALKNAPASEKKRIDSADSEIKPIRSDSESNANPAVISNSNSSHADSFDAKEFSSASTRAENAHSESAATIPSEKSPTPAKSKSESSAGLMLTKNMEETSDVSQIITNPHESDLETMAQKSEGKPFLINENGEIIRVVPKLDSLGKIIFKDGKMQFSKVKLNKKQKLEIKEISNTIKKAKELDHLPVRKMELDAILKKTNH